MNPTLFDTLRPSVIYELTPTRGIPKFAVAGSIAGWSTRRYFGRPRLADEQRVTTSTDYQSWIDRSYGRDRL